MTEDEKIELLNQAGALDEMDINEDDVRDGHHRATTYLRLMDLAYRAGFDAGRAAA